MKAAQIERRAHRKRVQDQSPPILKQSPTTSFSGECYWLDIETIQRTNEELYEFLKQLRLPKFFDSVLSDPNTWTTDVTALKFSLLAIFQVLPIDATSSEICYGKFLDF